MNKELKEGIIVSLVAVAAYLIYKQVTKPKDILKTDVATNDPDPVKIGLPVEDPNKPVEQVLINAPINI
jgi:hypothetical protein